MHRPVLREYLRRLRGGLLLLLIALGTAVTAPVLAQEPLVVNLLSSLQPLSAADYKVAPEFSAYSLYVTEYDKGGRHWYRLRLGVFADRTAAAAALQQLRKSYPEAWLDRAAVGEPRPPVKTADKATPAKASVANAVVPVDAEKRYAINLLVSLQPLTATAQPELAGRPDLQVYTMDTERRGNVWYFLRVGFFADRSEAEALLPLLQRRYPEARVLRVTLHELSEVSGRQLSPLPSSAAALPPAGKGRSAGLLDAARMAMTQGEFDQAVRLYQQAVDEGDADTAQLAQEWLGVAQERRGDAREARLAYDRYLAQYPEGEGAGRVRQRLAALATATAAPKAELKPARERERRAQYMFYGSLTALYRRDANVSDVEGETVAQSALTTYLDATGRVRDGAYDTRVRFTGSRRSDFLPNGPGDDNRLSTFYLDVLNRDADWSLRLGRQSSSSGGVLGRFDGVLGGVRMTPGLRVNAVAGYPVETTAQNGINEHKSFAGLSLDISGLADNWEFQLYGIEQQADSYVDRRAIGGEARYFQAGRTFFGLADYDVQFEQLNTAMLLGSWPVTEATSLNLMYDWRQSPTLSTSNALQGQAVIGLDQLSLLFSDEQIRQLALDRTAQSETVMVGVAHTLSERFQLTADVTASQIGATPASGGVDATPDTGTEYFVTTQLVGRGVFWQDDISILGIRFGDTQSIDSTALFVNSRVPAGHWQFNPRAQLEYRQDSSNRIDYWLLRPSLIASYRRWERHTLEAEAGAELTTRQDVPQGYYFGLHYRWDF